MRKNVQVRLLSLGITVSLAMTVSVYGAQFTSGAEGVELAEESGFFSDNEPETEYEEAEGASEITPESDWNTEETENFSENCEELLQEEAEIEACEELQKFELSEETEYLTGQSAEEVSESSNSETESEMAGEPAADTVQRDLSKCRIVLSASTVFYTGKAQTPSIQVLDGEKQLKNEVDYTLLYTNNVSMGTASVVISGMGEYTGSVTKNFAIKLAAPTLKNIVSKSGSSIKLTWKKVPGAKSYIVYYKGGTAEKWKKVAGNITAASYTHVSSKSRPLNAGVSYTYTVKAVSGKATSSYDKLGLTVKPVPAAVKLKSIESAAYNKLKISWKPVEGADGYYIYRKTNGKWKKIGTTKKTTYVHTGSSKNPIKTGIKYTYTVKAYCKNGKKAVSGGYDKNGITGKTVADQPELVSIESTAANTATIKWKKAPGATGYIIYRKNTGGKWIKIRTINEGNTVSYTHKQSSGFPVEDGAAYTYTVRSYTSTGKTKGLFDKKGLTVKIVIPVPTTDAQLRKKAQEIISRVTTPSMTKEQKLRACWYWVMNCRFYPSDFPDKTKFGWQRQCAMDLFNKSQGNCYGYAHGFAALARELGYVPYVIEIPKVHCFVLINGGYWDNMGNKMGVPNRPMSYSSNQITRFTGQ